MDKDRAIALIEATESGQEKNEVMQGLQILAKYVDDVSPEFGHDIIWASDFEETVTKMTEEDIIRMAELNWFHFEENECWAHF